MTKWQKRLYKKYAKCVFYTHFALLIHKRHNFVICDMSQWQYADRLILLKCIGLIFLFSVLIGTVMCLHGKRNRFADRDVAA